MPTTSIHSSHDGKGAVASCGSIPANTQPPNTATLSRLVKRPTFALLLSILSLAACGGGPGGDEPAVESSNTAEVATDYSFECPPLDGVTPLEGVRATIEANERAFLEAALAQDQRKLDELLSDSMSYVHENGQVSTKQQFFDDYLAQGYQQAVLTPKEDMRQFCSTVFTVHTGHLRLNGEPEHPPTTVTHVWAKQGQSWLLDHRHESHKGGPIGPQLPQQGGPNDTDKVGARPTPEVQKIITENEAAWVNAMITTNREAMERLIGDSLHYVHVTAHTSTRADFMEELMGGFTETDFVGTTLRQFGNTVIALHNAHYRHVDEPDQSRSQAMHAWVKQGERWVLVARHSARFEPW